MELLPKEDDEAEVVKLCNCRRFHAFQPFRKISKMIKSDQNNCHMIKYTPETKRNMKTEKENKTNPLPLENPMDPRLREK